MANVFGCCANDDDDDHDAAEKIWHKTRAINAELQCHRFIQFPIFIC